MIGIQGNFNKMPIPIPQSIPQPNEQEEILEDQNIENIDGQDYITEVLNISKIKEGFYIGDKIAAISIEVVVQFKLTHMINASGNQIINQWETIGMKYLTLNWSENPNQILFDPNDEIADKILYFIDDSCINGEGLLAHSFKGQDRVCIVVLIYLMKKYKWSLKKSMEYLKSKKQDVDIPPFFLSQLIKFESRLIQRGELTKDIPWSFENLKDPEEKLLRNTYMNGINFINKQNLNDDYMTDNKSNLRHIIWADSNPYQQIPISVIDLDRDLFFKQNIKPVVSHQQKRPLKSCIKTNKKYDMAPGIEKEEKMNRAPNNVNNNIINNLIKRNLINNNVNNLIISGNKSKNRKAQNAENYNDENNRQPNTNNIQNKNEIIKNSVKMKSGMINNNNIPNKNGVINNNYIINNNNVINMINNNQIKKNLKRNISDSNNQQINQHQNQNYFYNNNYNLNNEGDYNYVENPEPNLGIKSGFNNIDNNNIENMKRFEQNEMMNYQIYERKDNKMNNLKINKKEEYSYTPNDNPKEENIIIIANKYDNIIKNNINNYYINQIGTINNNMNNPGNSLNNIQNNNFAYENNNMNKNKLNKKNNKKSLKNEMNNNSKDKSIKKQNDFEEMPQEMNVKEFNTGLFNNNKVVRNNFKNILGNNHKQILGISNDNPNNFVFKNQSYNIISNNSESNKTPKGGKNIGKIMNNLSNNSNEKRFKIIDNNSINNYNRNNVNNKISNMNNKGNRNNYNLNENKNKSFEFLNNPLNQFIGRTSPKNIKRDNNNIKYDPIISNYNPIKKHNKKNRPISSNSKSSNYQGNENYENSNLNNINVNNYNVSSNKPLNNFNPHLIKRKGTPTAGHQMIKINNVSNNPVKIKNNILINSKKPSTPDMIINKSSTSMVNNNSYIGPKINNTSNLFNYGINKSANLSNNSFHRNKSKKIKNYNHMKRPATAPHKDKTSKDKKGGSMMNSIQDSKKGINNYNKNAYKANQRPASAGQGKNNHKNENIKYNNTGLIGANIGKKIELNFGNKPKNAFAKKRMGSPQLLSNNKVGLGNNNNNPKFNIAKYRVPSPMIKSTSLGGKTFMNNNKNNMNFNMNKNLSFNMK